MPSCDRCRDTPARHLTRSASAQVPFPHRVTHPARRPGLRAAEANSTLNIRYVIRVRIGALPSPPEETVSERPKSLRSSRTRANATSRSWLRQRDLAAGDPAGLCISQWRAKTGSTKRRRRRGAQPRRSHETVTGGQKHYHFPSVTVSGLTAPSAITAFESTGTNGPSCTPSVLPMLLTLAKVSDGTRWRASAS